MANERTSGLGILDLEAAAETDLRAVEVHEVGENLPWVITIDSSAEVIPSNHGQEGDNLRFNHLLIRNPDLIQFDLSLHTPALIVLNPDASTLSVGELAVFAPVVVVVERHSPAVDRVEEMYREGATVVLDRASDPRILNAAINEALRRKLMPLDNKPTLETIVDNLEAVPQENPILEIGELEINMEKVETKYHGEVVKLTAKELGILLELAKNKDRVVSEPEIVETVWEHLPDNHTILSMRVILSRLRKKIPGLIQTVRKHGYIIKSPIEDQS